MIEYDSFLKILCFPSESQRRFVSSIVATRGSSYDMFLETVVVDRYSTVFLKCYSVLGNHVPLFVFPNNQQYVEQFSWRNRVLKPIGLIAGG